MWLLLLLSLPLFGTLFLVGRGGLARCGTEKGFSHFLGETQMCCHPRTFLPAPHPRPTIQSSKSRSRSLKYRAMQPGGVTGDEDGEHTSRAASFFLFSGHCHRTPTAILYSGLLSPRRDWIFFSLLSLQLRDRSLVCLASWLAGWLELTPRGHREPEKRIFEAPNY